MTTREFYIERRKTEFPTFMKVLKALPKDQLDYKPDERSLLPNKSPGRLSIRR